jgi:hypothetical protein
VRRHPALTVSAVVLATGVGSAIVVAQATGGSDDGPGDRRFVGYWMGMDPLDSGDSRRGITRNGDRTFSMIGRDTVFTLCDDTDRAIVRVDARVAGSALVSDDLTIECTNTGATVRLRYRFELTDRDVARETVTRPNGEPVDQIVFHRLSER